MRVIKRSGEKVNFDRNKIIDAAKKAWSAVHGTDVLPDNLSNMLNDYCEELASGADTEVETIQDNVILMLHQHDAHEVEKAYIRYRERRAIARDTKIDAEDLINQYIKVKDDMAVHENSSTSYSLQGLNQFIHESVISKKWLRLYSDEIKKAHDTGRMHIHDLGSLAPYCFTGDTKVYCLDGQNKTFKELCDTGVKEFWTFAIDSEGKEIPALAKNPKITRKNAELIEITLDNKEKIKCTPDHLFMLRDGSYRQASKLTPSDSLRALYHIDTKSGYRLLLLKDERIYEHRHVASFFNDDVNEKNVVHHINSNKLDNRPENLEVMLDRDHRSMECSIIMNRAENKQKCAARLASFNKSEEQRKKSSERMQLMWEAKKSWWEHFKNKEDKKKYHDYLTYVQRNGFLPIEEYDKTYNHRIVSIRTLETKEDVYDVTVETYNNFLLAAGVFVHNCMGHDLMMLVEEGFTGVPEKTCSRPAKHFGVALGQCFNFLYTLQGESAGAQAFSNFNTLLAPFVHYDELTYKQVKQAMQEFIYNLNVPTRTGFQAPFTNLTLDLDVTKTDFADRPAIIGGKPMEKTYREFQKEAMMINQAMIEIMEEGDAHGAMFPYPIITFNVTKDFPWKAKFGESLLRLTAKYGSPYFANYINSEYAESDITSMCCRLRLDKREIKKYLTEYTGGLEKEDYEKTHQRGGGFFGAAANTGSLGVVTLNLAALMKDAKDKAVGDNWNEFLSEVQRYMDLAMESLLKKRREVELSCEDNLYPYTKYYLRHVKERTGHYFTQHFNTIAINAMHEALVLYGIPEGMNSKDGQELAYHLLTFMNNYSVRLQEKHKVLVNVEQAPAESAGVKLCKKSGIDPLGNGYYTNSTWFPADSSIDIMEQIHAQGKLNEKYTGGSVVHIYTDADLVPVYKDLQKIIEYAFTHTKLPYLTISPVFSVCPKCGRVAGNHETCPKCGGAAEVYSRVVGYYRNVSNFNEGKKKEFKKRRFTKI